MIRKLAHYTGRVQGVGFRANAQRLAHPLGVKGYAKNLPDGRVELLAEGPAAQVDQLLQQIQDSMSRNIQHVEVHESQPTGTWHGFVTL